MDVTTMAKISSLAAKLRKDFPDVSFEKSDDFYWSPSSKTVHIGSESGPDAPVVLLHEVAHALLDHRHFNRDIDLLRIEREAWEYVRTTLAPRYDMAVRDELVEDMIDTYREWLHARSTCPHCAMTGVQTKDATYHCVGCDHDWKVNDARRCGLRRYSLTTT